MKLRLLPFVQASAAELMATDEAILTSRTQNKAINTIRFYQWKPKAVTIGYFQNAAKEVDLLYINKNKIDLVRRITGGGAVFHDHELTYSIIIDSDDIENGKEILVSYKTICNAIIQGLCSLGINPIFSPINDLLVNGKKFSGNAQTRRDNIILQHGTILLRLNLEQMFSALKVTDEKISDKLIQSTKSRVTCLGELGIDNPKTVRTALIQGFQSNFNAQIEEQQLSKHEKQLAEKLYKQKYSQDSWNLKR